MDILYFVNNRLCSKLILPATMSVKSNPFLTDLRWTWLGRVAKPTYSLSWSWKTDRNMTWWLSCNGPRRRIVDLGSLIKPTENNVKPSHKTKQRAKLRFPQKSWSNFLTLFDFFSYKGELYPIWSLLLQQNLLILPRYCRTGQIDPTDSWAWRGTVSRTPRSCSEVNWSRSPSPTAPQPSLAAVNGSGGGLPPHRPCLHREPHGRDAGSGGDCVGGDGEGLA